MKKLIILLAIVLASSCLDDDNEVVIQNPNIVEIAQTSPELSTLVAAVIQADLVSVLSSPGPFTVLAPTNEAFNAFLTANNFSSLDEVPNDVLTQILLNHVINGEINSEAFTQLGSGYTNTNASGPDDNVLSLYFETEGESIVLNGGPEVTDIRNVLASNGIVHVIDEVIALPTLATFATTNPALSDLVTALGSADSQDPSPMLIPTLSNPEAGPFTVFTPTNDAFDGLLMELDDTGMTTLEDLDPATVEAVLGIHIVEGNIQSSQLTDGFVTTFGGEDIFISVDDLFISDPNMRQSNIIPSLINIQAVNGVAHVIDRVLLPPQ